MEAGTIDLDQLALKGGEGRRFELSLEPPAPVVGGEPYELAGGSAAAKVDISRTTSGWALKLTSEVVLGGPCARCLEPAELRIPVSAREVDQPGTGDAELQSPYVDDGVLDVTAWLHDAITLSLPEKVLCRPGCAGICEVCGVSLNDVDPETHHHDAPLDPRFAKLRELLPDED